MNLPEIFLNWQSAAVALVIYAITESLRRAVQSLWKSWRSNRFYTEFVLFVLPVSVGALLGATVSSFAWPAELKTTSSRVMYAAVLGLFAGAIYGWSKRFLGAFFQTHGAPNKD